ncbi:hypothetical protein PTSG_00918 [Salpingoeca rosetta]|uniref:SH3 domain-containing protein n=1 Tax=Salpingoeca rosetta (strain ATCC 50818 / BSB-021) TaxID=946362 RepID=F2TXV6_SALR5|nr:uncharacterized protein PTSG_00918 [Salpingoeca rosetta]EGD76215.1 hypothetical protein PTSG_00918 [Salpingoeca rosetta]|eukprot:XP_004998390.1 hypothetical protein PTSG_00918 [Salpingoeca rosetta]
MPWDEEDWSLQLAADGATEISMHDINTGAPDALRRLRETQLKDRKDRVQAAAKERKTAEATDALKEKNRKALEKLRQKRAERLPEGWRMVESRSRPGQYVYENIHTEERQAWFPTEPAVKIDPAKFDEEPAPAPSQAPGGLSEEAKERNRRALAARKAKNQGMLPDGWRRVESRSRPGEYVYENVYTEERIAWYPIMPAKHTEDEGWRARKMGVGPGFVWTCVQCTCFQAITHSSSSPDSNAALHRAAMPMQSLKPGASAETATAMYPYAAENDEEIDLQEGDELLVEFKGDNGWWVGTNKRTGMLGMFPGGFVELK